MPEMSPHYDLLVDLFEKADQSYEGVSARAFRAERAELIPELDKLESEGSLIREDDRYQVSVLELPELAEYSVRAESVLYLCEHVFTKLSELYKREPGASHTFKEVSEYADIPAEGIKEAATYFKHVGLFDAYTTDFEQDGATITPGEKFIRAKSFRDCLIDLKLRSKTALGTAISFDQEPSASVLAESIHKLLHPYVAEQALPQFQDGHLRDAVLNSIMAVFEIIKKTYRVSRSGWGSTHWPGAQCRGPLSRSQQCWH